MSDTQRFEHESYQDAQSIKAYFTSLVEGFDKGRIILNSQTDQIELALNTFMKFKLRARKKGEKHKIEITISWQNRSEHHRNDIIQIG